ncbi:helix-turn-helix domain-containing protein [Endozoicomonas sp. SESOKO3]|uniref:helix-turn-helix domain-containing protein n=2 Tax=unclassified Endozoicomonas TaxID=2644528 RepID=UPI0021477F96|nr:helix-turn-helix transcriptional regulator [Endozoicomonas sp. SESOKO3]
MASSARIIDYSGVLNAQENRKPHMKRGELAAVYRFQPIRETGVVNEPVETGPINMAIPGDNVRRLRLEKGWSMRELAERCVTEEKTMDHTTIMRLEKDKGYTRATLERVAKALGLRNHEDLFVPEELAGFEKLDDFDRAQIANMVQALALSAERRQAVNS